jgi:hypothetical protein
MKVDGKPKISFFAVGNPGFLDIEGVSNTMTVVDDGTKLVFTVPMASVKTGIDTRDEHMNDKYVVQGKFPDAILTLAKADVQWPTEVGAAASGSSCWKACGPFPQTTNFYAGGFERPYGPKYSFE